MAQSISFLHMSLDAAYTPWLRCIGVSPQRSAQINIRCTPDEKKELERRAAAAEKELQRTRPRAKLGLGPWMIDTCLADGEDADRKERKNGGRK